MIIFANPGVDKLVLNRHHIGCLPMHLWPCQVRPRLRIAHRRMDPSLVYCEDPRRWAPSMTYRHKMRRQWRKKKTEHLHPTRHHPRRASTKRGSLCEGKNWCRRAGSRYTTQHQLCARCVHSFVAVNMQTSAREWVATRITSRTTSHKTCSKVKAYSTHKSRSCT